jgi:macrophage erythroblast attacher
MEQDKLNHEGLLALEQPLIKVPLEMLKREFRASQRTVERELSSLSTQVQLLSTLNDEQKPAAIEAQIQRLETLKRKLTDVSLAPLTASRARIAHLSDVCNIPTASSDDFARWSKIRLSRVICDYLLRKGYIETAKRLADECNLAPLVDIDLFADAQKVLVLI